MIAATNIHKSFNGLEVLKGIDLKINKGEIVAIVGASGAGKTTLLQIIGTLDKPTSGQILLNGVNAHQLTERKLSAFRNKHIGFVFQFHHLLPEFTALENLCIPAFIAGINRKKAENRANELLDFLHLTDRSTHKPSELSGGEQQRVAVARALMNNPGIILADEPSGNLDSVNARELHKLFFDLRKEFNQTFVIVTHNKEFADMSDRKLVIADGKLL
ncbi:MAG TPA: ABC transporter ATP-binding protein [Bacteroidales bacterium]|jgi:lipoprotein-releasing system ATP-binding protein|nr:ABC transporter ATP-binding protein [Bacteroidales bacterium]